MGAVAEKAAPAPEPNPVGCALRLEMENDVIVIEVSQDGCRLKYPSLDSCPTLRQWQETPLFIKAMQAAGLDVFPALSVGYQPTVIKVRMAR